MEVEELKNQIRNVYNRIKANARESSQGALESGICYNTLAIRSLAHTEDVVEMEKEFPWLIEEEENENNNGW